MLINKGVWSSMSVAQQTLLLSVSRDHVISSYGENMRKQGAALKTILSANKTDANPDNDLVLVAWPKKDQALLRDATTRFLAARAVDSSLGTDRDDFVRIVDAYRSYIRANDVYWDDRGVDARLRFGDWANAPGEGLAEKKAK
jgi:hypothetical protein